jgi:hypothetical protein
VSVASRDSGRLVDFDFVDRFLLEQDLSDRVQLGPMFAQGLPALPDLECEGSAVQ